MKNYLYICTVVSSEALTGYKGGRQTYIERDVEQTFYLWRTESRKFRHSLQDKAKSMSHGFCYTYIVTWTIVYQYNVGFGIAYP